VCPPVVASQRPGKRVPRAMNTHLTVGDRVNSVFSVLLSLQNFNVGGGGSAPELYTIGPDAFEYGFIE
jgi:hypothetical protein